MRLTQVVLAVCVAVVLCGCSEDEVTGPAAGAPGGSGSVSGTIALEPGYGGGTAVHGTLYVAVGTDTLLLAVDGVLGDDHRIGVDYVLTGVSAGRTVVVYVADLVIGNDSLLLAGYAIIEVAAGQEAVVDSGAYVDIAVGDGVALSDGPPVITALSASASSVTVAHVTVSASVSNVDVGNVFIFVNNNCFPVLISPDSQGDAAFSSVVSLQPGANTIFVVAVNSNGGIALSSSLIVTYSVQGGSRVMLGTLIWNTPTSDMDFHVWYYESPSPALPATASQHCCYWNKDLVGILPDGFEPNGNLDVDDTEGEGPEHMTFIDYPDGYYVFAVNSYSLDQDDHAFCTVTLSAGGQQRSMQHLFTTQNYESYSSDMDAWVRCFDVRVLNGVASILDPNPAFVYHESALMKAAVSARDKGK